VHTFKEHVYAGMVGAGSIMFARLALLHQPPDKRAVRPRLMVTCKARRERVYAQICILAKASAGTKLL